MKSGITTIPETHAIPQAPPARLAIYAHYGATDVVAPHVLYYLEKLHQLARICFVSNSGISGGSRETLRQYCERVIVRENEGLDWGMWQRGMAEYDLSQFEELLLTNSSIIGPMQPLAPLWQCPGVVNCDWWGLTDSDEFKPHLSPYFVVFRQRVLRSARFHDFWRSVLPYPYQSKQQVIFSYELGLSDWLQAGGFKWQVVFPQKQIIEDYRSSRSPWQKSLDLYHRRALRWRCTLLMYPDILCRCGMPFLKASLLYQKNHRMTPSLAFALLERSALPPEILQDLRQTYGIPGNSSAAQ